MTINRRVATIQYCFTISVNGSIAITINYRIVIAINSSIYIQKKIILL